MGRTHAASGAAVWLVGCAIAASEGVDIGVHHVVVGAGITAYGAVLPDIDMRKSNVALSLGWPTKITAHCVARFGAWLHDYTRLPKDRVDKDGHRTITHSLLFCVAMTVLFGLLALRGGPIVGAVLVTLAVATAVRSLLKPGERRFKVRVKRMVGKGKRTVWLSRPVVSGLAAAVVMFIWPAPSGWWIGIAVGVGCLMHNLGDALTNTGVPLFFPWEIRGCRWHCVRVREEWRFETKQESRAERRIYRLCSVAATLSMGLVLYLAWPDALAAASGWFSALVEGFRDGTVEQ
jgi:membrane-bound metal-dependent hydrolase YbcI (DUF457 family)